jgi:hypothetical protein
MAFGVGLMTPVPYPIAHALIGGLSADSLVKHPEALQVFPDVRLVDFDSATRDALAKTHPAQIEHIWEDGRQGVKSIKHEGCFIDYRTVHMAAEPDEVIRALQQWVDTQAGFIKAKQTNRQILVCVKHQIAGEKWIEWRVGQIARGASPGDHLTYLSQTIFFCPRGLPGFLYWYLFYPIHFFKSYLLIQKVLQTLP